jgi:hypothetical protein
LHVLVGVSCSAAAMDIFVFWFLGVACVFYCYSCATFFYLQRVRCFLTKINTQTKNTPQTKEKEKRQNAMPTQYNCSRCTAAVCSTTKYPPCTRCHMAPAFTCTRCLVDWVLPTTTCVNCTARKHICLSACFRRCVRAKGPPPKCRCGVEARRLQVGKAGKNHGRFFRTCAQSKCKLFEWESPFR